VQHRRALDLLAEAQFDRARKAAGLRGGPHTVRHTFASHFLAGQPDIGLLAQVLGHSEESVTRLYQHMLPSAWRARSLVSIGLPPARGTAQIVNASAVDAQPAQPAGSERDHEKRLPRRLPRAKGPRLASEPLDLLGAGNRIRTGDPQLGQQAAASSPKFGATLGATVQAVLRARFGEVELTVGAVAERLRVSTATVYSLCRRGELEHHRISVSPRRAPC